MSDYPNIKHSERWAYSKTWPDLGPHWTGQASKMAWPQFGLAPNFALASKIGLTSNLVSTKEDGGGSRVKCPFINARLFS